MKVIFPEFQDKKFSWTDYRIHYSAKAKKFFISIILFLQSKYGMLKALAALFIKLNFFKDTRCFTSAGDVRLLYEKLEDLLDLLEDTADKGFKKPILNDGLKGAPFELYQNDMLLGHNTIVAQIGKSHIVYLNHSVINYVGTRDVGFCEYTVRHMQNLMRKSTLISSVSEKERRNFFMPCVKKYRKEKSAVN
jgi:hypothetical protein